ncbi:MAG: hypothetical protein JXR75_06415 [Rhodobacteraceae bacterium]|nr:hypothetical protein [Paracoccaceae bacterium]
MSIWTNKAALRAARVSLASLTGLAGLMGLVACQTVGGPAGLPTLSLLAQPPVAVLGGSMVLAAAKGYCPDPAMVTQTDGAAVALIGRCSDRETTHPAVLTVSIGQAGSGSAMAAGQASVVAFLQGDAGRAMLSRDGKADNVKIISARGVDGQVLLQVQDVAIGRHWRAMLDVSGRLVSITAVGPGLPDAVGRALVQDTAAALRRANRTPGQVPLPERSE